MKNLYGYLIAIMMVMGAVDAVAQIPPYHYTPNLITLNTIPLNSTSNMRQNLYYPSDFNAPSGMVNKIYLGAGSATSPSFTPLTIKVGPTLLTTFTTGPWATGLTTVFSSNITLNAVNGWFEITLTTPFFYDNTQNLIIEISQGGYSNSSSTPMASSTAVPSTTNRTLYGASTSASGTVQPRLMKVGFFLIPNDNDLAGVAIVHPLGNTQVCPLPETVVRASIKNMGALAQTNFQVTGYYSGITTGTVNTIYTGTLLPGATDTVDFPATAFQPGMYSMKTVTGLASDTVRTNDTTPAVNFTVKAFAPIPIAYSDTVCAGGNALLYIDAQPGATYNWYSALSGGSMLTNGSTVSFTPLTVDTIMYVSSLLNGCESVRMPVSGIFGLPPVVNLGPDTSFCESIPLVLDGANPGGKYLWSTGDTVQSISLTNQSGKFWVTVDRYCVASDTVDVTIAPRPVVNGISYVRSDREYHFSPSGDMYIDNYLWLFGDGASSTLRTPVHTYANDHFSAVDAQLIVSNECGTDTVLRTVPTSVTSPNALEDQISIYPNPAGRTLVISSGTASVEAIIIMDMMGRTSLRSVNSGNKKQVIDVTHLPPGNYIIRINTDLGEVSKTLEIRR